MGVVLLGAALLVVILATATAALGLGSADISAGDVVDVVLRRLSIIPGENVTVETDRIVWELRMPRVLGSLSVGASLAICGVVLQSLTRNELADPYLLGISSGASVGAVAVAGPSGFVGLTIPHLVRIATGPGHRTLLPLAALAGAALLLVTDTLARTIRPDTEVPIGVITAVIGAPVLVFLLRRQAGQS